MMWYSGPLVIPYTKCVRQDDVAGRIGGDEFMLFMGGIKDADHLTRFADRVYKALKDNPDFNATCSMGYRSGQGRQYIL